MPTLEALPATETRTAESTLQKMMSAASLAPSADNLQPWRMRVDRRRNALEIDIDLERDRSPLNAGQRMSAIACGAAAENALQVARASGWRTEFEIGVDPPTADRPTIRAATIRLLEPLINGCADEVMALCRARVTNRRRYDRRPIPAELLERLTSATPAADGLTTHWITERSTVDALSPLMARGDAVMFGHAGARNAFLSTVRFDLPVKATADEGMPLGSLEISAAQRATLRALPYIPNWLFAATAGPQLFSMHARKLAASASGLCVVAVDHPAEDHPIRIGRALQRAWLAMTAHGLAAQPMMSVPGLDNALERGSPEFVAALRRSGAPELVAVFQTMLNGAGVAGKPVFVLRFGYAAPPTARTGRRAEGGA